MKDPEVRRPIVTGAVGDSWTAWLKFGTDGYGPSGVPCPLCGGRVSTGGLKGWALWRLEEHFARCVKLWTGYLAGFCDGWEAASMKGDGIMRRLKRLEEAPQVQGGVVLAHIEADEADSEEEIERRIAAIPRPAPPHRLHVEVIIRVHARECHCGGCWASRGWTTPSGP